MAARDRSRSGEARAPTHFTTPEEEMNMHAAAEAATGTADSHGSGARSSSTDRPGSVAASTIPMFAPDLSPASNSRELIKELERCLGALSGDYASHTKVVSEWSIAVDQQLQMHARAHTDTAKQINDIKQIIEAVHM